MTRHLLRNGTRSASSFLKASLVTCTRRCLSTSLVRKSPDASTQTSQPSNGTVLGKIIADSIKVGGASVTRLLVVSLNVTKATGPMPVARYMQLCLSHPTEGYYMKRQVFGSQGDFITSPEISQVFGEVNSALYLTEFSLTTTYFNQLLAIWLLTQWIAKGKPASTRLVELGPGRGTLMADVLRVGSSRYVFPGWRSPSQSRHYRGFPTARSRCLQSTC